MKKIIYLCAIIFLLTIISACHNDDELSSSLDDFIAYDYSINKGGSTFLVAITSGDVPDNIQFKYNILSGDGMISSSTNKYAVFTAGNQRGKAVVQVLMSNDTTLLAQRELTLQIKGEWNIVGDGGLSDGVAEFIDVEIAPDGTPYIIYQDKTIGGWPGTVKKYEGDEWILVGSKGQATEDSKFLYSPDLIFSDNGELYFAYMHMYYGSFGSGPYKSGKVRKFNGSEWETITNFFISDISTYANYPQYITLLMCQSNIPHVIFRDPDIQKASAVFYTNSVFTNYDVGAFSDTDIKGMAAKKDQTGRIYAAYIDSVQEKVTVVYNEGSVWLNLGSAGFTEPVSCISMDLDSQGNPYIVFLSKYNENKMSVMVYSNSQWTYIGDSLFTQNANNPKIIIDNNDTPFVIYQDTANAGRLTAKVFINNKWEYAGLPAFSTGYSDFISVALDKNNNNIYVAYKDVSNNGKATVMVYK